MLVLHLPQIIVAWLAIVALVASTMALVWAYAPRVDPSAIVSVYDAPSPVRALGESERYMLCQLRLAGMHYARRVLAFERALGASLGMSALEVRALRAAGATLARGPKGRMVSLRYTGSVHS